MTPFPNSLDLDAEERAALEAALRPRSLAPGERFILEGDVARVGARIESGVLRYYTVRDGHEHVTGFDVEGAMVGDLASFFLGMPSGHTIEAVEPCRLSVLTYEAFEGLKSAIPALEAVRSMVAEQLWMGERTRAAEAQQLSAEERYRRLAERSPHLLQRVPLYHIASYLGVTPEALSRIRRRL